MERFVISIRSVSFSRETAVPARCRAAHWLVTAQSRVLPPPSVRLASQSSGGVGEAKTGVQEGGN